MTNITLWKNKIFYLEKEEIGILVKHKKYKKMYYYKFPDGTLSEDFYNISRAKDNFKYEYQKRVQNYNIY